MSYVKIPKEFHVGGKKMEVRDVARCDDNSLGTAFLAGGYVEIANACNKEDSVSEGCKINTFYHELTHAILDTMGEKELSQNEKFVCSFSSFLTEAMTEAFFHIRDSEILK